MNRLHGLDHHLAFHFFRIAAVAVGLTLLWYGSSRPSVVGLVAMFIGLVAVVRAISAPRSGLHSQDPPFRLT
jgi:hypothetical protein